MSTQRTVTVQRPPKAPKPAPRASVVDTLAAAVADPPVSAPSPKSPIVPREFDVEVRNVYDPKSGEYVTVSFPARVPDAAAFGAIRKMMAAGRNGFPPSSFGPDENAVINAHAAIIGWCADVEASREVLDLLFEDVNAMLRVAGGLLAHQARYFRRPVGADGTDSVEPVVLLAGAALGADGPG